MSASAVAVGAPMQPIPPWAAIEGQSQLAPCDSLVLSFAGVEAVRPMEYSWHCATDVKVDVALAMQKGAFVNVSKEVLDMSGLAEFAITVRVRSFLGRYSNTATFRTQRMKTPVLSLSVRGTRRASLLDEPLMRVVAAFPPCFGARGAVSYQWFLDAQTAPGGLAAEVEPALFLSAKPYLLLPRLRLRAGGVYIVGVRASTVGNNDEKAVAYHTLYIDSQPLVARIAGGNRKARCAPSCERRPSLGVSSLSPFLIDLAESNRAGDDARAVRPRRDGLVRPRRADARRAAPCHVCAGTGLAHGRTTVLQARRGSSSSGAA
jgi:hypothetical protein